MKSPISHAVLQLWPKLAAHFDMDCGPIMPLSLVKQMADKEELWSKIVQVGA